MDGFDERENGLRRWTGPTPDPDRKIVYRNGQPCVEVQVEEPPKPKTTFPSPEEAQAALYGEDLGSRLITIPDLYNPSDHCNRVKLSEVPRFFHERIAWAAENSGRKEFVSTLEHANTTLKGLGCVDERITKRLDELANDGRNCINDDEFSSTVQKVRSIFRELRLESKQG